MRFSTPSRSTSRKRSTVVSLRIARLAAGGISVGLGLSVLGLLLGLAWPGGAAMAQVSVVTEHNDIGRTGQNTGETVLNPANVTPSTFGKLFSHAVSGEIFAQPLYVPRVAIANKGIHNVAYVATYNDMVYAFDADANGGIDAGPLWQVALRTNTAPAGTYTSNSGVQGTPVIDLASQTMYLVSSEVQAGKDLYRLHALDISSGAEKFGGPVIVSAAVAGTGSGSSGGVLTFDPQYHYQRPGLLLLNGILYFAFGSVNDNGPWHGWLFSYNATTLRQIAAYCTTPNGSGGGIWMGGAGLAAEVDDPARPYGRMFLATGNGSYAAAKPYTDAMSYGMSVLDLDLTGGKMTVQDEFTPANEAMLNSQDGDLGSGGPVVLPAQTLASGKALDPLLQVGKSGAIYILDRDSDPTVQTAYQPAGLGGFLPSGDKVVQKVQTPQTGAQGWGAGIWGSGAYWNRNIYLGGTNPGASNGLTAYSFINGVLSTAPTSTSYELFSYPAPTPSVSANGVKDGIVWVLDSHAYVGGGPEALYAYDATDLSNLLYSSNANVSRDAPGPATRNVLPTIANGKVYVGASYQFSAYGLLGSVPTAPPPAIGPAPGAFAGSQQVTITDAVPGATIYYTLDGSLPTTASNVYSGPFKIYSSETVTAVASPTGYLQSAAAVAVYSSTSNAANPVFSLAAGSYSGAQTLTITDATPGAAIRFTIDGTPPTASSSLYSGPIAITVTETLRAVATAPGLEASTVVSAAYTIRPVYTIDFSQGFSAAQRSGQMQLNGSADLDDFRLQLTNGGPSEAGSAFSIDPVDIRQFTTDFTFQLSNPAADGFTFTIQGVGPSALGGPGSGLGFVTIQHSVAIKFDLYNNAGEGSNSTGIYTYGNAPTTPALDLSGSPIDLHSGNYIDAHITYDGTTLTLTLTNPISLGNWSHSWPINIPLKVGGNTAWVGFTGGTGGLSSSQKLTSWTLTSGPPAVPNFPAGFDGVGLTSTGVALAGAALQLTSGTPNQTSSVFSSSKVNIESFSTAFAFTVGKASNQVLGDGFALVIQNAGGAALGGPGSGLGYTGIPNSLAIKFDLYNNAGEGSDSTGMYLNGSPPTIPSSDMTSSTLQLGSGDVIQVHVTYDGTTLTWRLEDLSSANPHVYSQSVAVNIPHVIGANTAYIGFTAASGSGSAAVQRLLNWTVSSLP